MAQIRLFVDYYGYVNLPGLMTDESEDSDEIVELDLITSCAGTKAVPVQVPKQEPKDELKSAPIKQDTLLGMLNKICLLDR